MKTIPSHPTIVGFDVVGSLATLREMQETAYEALKRGPLFACVETLRLRNDGEYIGSHMGDALLLYFPTIAQAITFSTALMEWVAEQQAADPNTKPTEIRLAVHHALKEMTADAKGDFGYQEDVGYHARILGIANAGQMLISENTKERGSIPPSRLKDYQRRYIKEWRDEPQTVYELLWDGVSKGEPGIPWIPNGFLDLGQYVSRPDKEKQVIDCFQKRNTGGLLYRIVTLHGYGGMGKTRLAVQCALNVAPFFKGKIYRVDLDKIPESPLSSGKDIAQFVAALIGGVFKLEGEKLLPANLPSHLPDYPLLLLLDNYESAKCPETDMLLARIVSQCAGVHLLLTGREAIENATIEKKVRITGLEADQAHKMFVGLMKIVKEVETLSLTDAEEAAVRSILEQIAYIPLGIQLAAAQTDGQSLVELRKGLEKTTVGDETSMAQGQSLGVNADRQRSLLKSLQYSFYRLSPEAQSLSPCLGLFEDDFSRTVVETVSGNSSALVLLKELVRAALLHFYTDSLGESRYSLLRPTRDYVRTLLKASPDADSYRKQYADHYSQLIRDCQEGVEKHNSDTMRRMQMEWRNAVAVCEPSVQLVLS